MPTAYETRLDKGQIRLLRVLYTEYNPENQQIFVVCTQKIVDLDSKPAYHAVSYTWKFAYQSLVWSDGRIVAFSEYEEGHLPRVHFYCDGTIIEVPPNLWFHLKNFPAVLSTSWIWADSICIRQHDDEEKAMQVPMMKDIYSSATAVLISLGFKTCVFSFGTMNDVLEVIESFVPNLRKALKEGSLQHADITPTCLSDETFVKKINVDDLVRKLIAFTEFCVVFRWFHRLWCMQEIVLAQAIVIHCGDRVVLWEKIEDLVLCLGYHCWYDLLMALWRTSFTTLKGEPNEWHGLLNMCMRRRILRYMDEENSDDSHDSIRWMNPTIHIPGKAVFTLEAVPEGGTVPRLQRPRFPHPSQYSNCAILLATLQAARCTNERDRVYGFLGVLQYCLHEDITDLIPVDYSKSVQRLYRDVFALFLEKSGSLDILTLQLPDSRSQMQRPSWVIDLQKPMSRIQVDLKKGQSASRGLEDFQRIHDLQLRPFKVHDSSITVFGGCLDVVTQILRYDQIFGIFSVGQKLPDLLTIRTCGRRRFETLWRTMIHNESSSIMSFCSEDEHNRILENYLLMFLIYAIISSILKATTLLPFDINAISTGVDHFQNALDAYELGPHSTTAQDYAQILRDCLDRIHKSVNISKDMENAIDTSTTASVVGADDTGLPPKRKTAKHSEKITKLTEAAEFYYRSLVGTVSRSLFITKTGLIGTCPKSTHTGDSIWILSGANAPFMLRSVNNDDNDANGERVEGTSKEKYIFVGDLFMLDFMNGEAISENYNGILGRLKHVDIV